MTTYKSRQESSPYRYFTMIPNMAIDDLDPFCLALLTYFTRWAGQGGTENKSLRQIAEATRMSVPKVRDTLQALAAAGYIKVQTPTLAERRSKQSTTVTILDRWSENVTRYSKDKTVQDIAQSDGDTVQDVSLLSVQDIARLKEPSFKGVEQEEPPPLPPSKPTPAEVDAAIYDAPRTARAPRQFDDYGPRAKQDSALRMERSMQRTHALYTAYAEQFKTPPPAPSPADMAAAWWAEDNGYTPAHIAKATAHRLKAGRGSSVFRFIIQDIHTLLQDAGPMLELVGVVNDEAPPDPARAPLSREEVDAIIRAGREQAQIGKSA